MSISQHPTITPSFLKWWRVSFQLMMKAPVRWYFIGLATVFVILVASMLILFVLTSTNDFGMLGLFVFIGMGFLLFGFLSLLTGISSAGSSQEHGEKPGVACLLKGFKLTAAGLALMITGIAIVLLIVVLFAVF